MTWNFIGYQPDVGGQGHQKNGQLSFTYPTRRPIKSEEIIIFPFLNSTSTNLISDFENFET